ncbi:hypothetical protein [Streptomyces sp. NRRL S-87]|uniref:phage tail protein n=1 Tax=Streptomyces sp. NRRL S-87 TaxID=1463920 RepID=UPI00068D8AED|nr:hypothetical protein [Streptomyces sp. NRRL S-87]
MKATADRPAGGQEPARDGARARRPAPSGASAAARPRPVDARALQRLQAGAGNAAVAALLGPRRAPGQSDRGGGESGGSGAGGGPGRTEATAPDAGTGARTTAPDAGTASALGTAPGFVPAPGLASAPGPDTAPRPDVGPELDAAPAPALQRLEALPAPPGGLSPATDPRFRKVALDLRTKKAALAAHPTAASQAKAAQDAARPPADDKEAQAKQAQAAEMGAATPGTFDKAAFVAAVSAAIAAKAPKTLDEADKFTGSGKTDEIKSQVAGQVKAGKDGSAKDITDRTNAAPDQSKAVEKPVTPLPGQPAPPTPAPPDPKAAAVAPAPAAQTDLSTGPRETDAMLAEARVTPEMLARSNEPQFKETLDAKKEADTHAATAPAQFRAAETARIAAEQGGAAAAGPAGVQAMTAARAGAGQQVAAGQGAARSKEEQERARVAAEIKGIFDATKKDVEGILGALDAEVETAFDSGQRQAKAAFDADHQTKMKAWKDERYSGVTGAARWLADAVLDPPPRANQIFAEARAVYEREMRAVITTVADLVGKRLGDATARIAQGKAQIAKKVEDQPRNLRQFAQQAAGDIGGEFRALESSVNEKSQSLVQDLADRYVAARDDLDKEIAALQEANKGLLSKAKDAVAGTLETVLKLKDMLLGVLARAAGAIDKIISNPIGFLGNLVNAVKAGVTGFASRIGEHLKNGLKQWLFGQLSAGGIEIPETFDAKGIIKLILSILGLTWSNIRTRIVAQIGEPAMKALETSFEMVQVLVSEGVGGLWKWIVGKLSDLKDTVVGAIKDFVVEKIVTAGITWIVSLLNPASAFVRACKAIYDVVMFFVNRAAQIKSFVDSVLDSIEGIAAGGGGGVPALIENSLAKALPVVLDFLASLLGLGGISEKIKSILAKVQAPVMQAVDWVVGKIAGAGKKLLSKLKAKAQGGDDSPEGKKARLDKGLAAAAAVANRYAGRPLSKLVVRAAFAAIKVKYGMQSLELVPAGRKWAVQGTVNPTDTVGTEALTEEQQAAGMMAAGDAAVEARVRRLRDELTAAETDKDGRQAGWRARKTEIEAVKARRDAAPPGAERQAAQREYLALCESQRGDLVEIEKLEGEIRHWKELVGTALADQEKNRVASFSELVKRLRSASAFKDANTQVSEPAEKKGEDFLGPIMQRPGQPADPMTAEHVFPMYWISRLVWQPTGGAARPIGFVQLSREHQLAISTHADNLVPLRHSVNSSRQERSWRSMKDQILRTPNLKDLPGIAAKVQELIDREARMETFLRNEVGRRGRSQGLGR